ncbi:hypothetical protein JTB14_029667 [Gonioctena quinquepunctata]|nr:hypothetical protein JTB14_029667 [Gonioctena quinquepunctata]
MRAPYKAILRERHITSTIDDIIQQVNGSLVSSRINRKEGYHQLPLKEESRYITTFSTDNGLYRYKLLNFGINAAAEIFQNTIRQVLVNIPGVINLSEDILIFGKSLSDHNKSLGAVLIALENSNLTINVSKCIFSTTKIKFLGFVFSKDPDPEKVQSFTNLQPPNNLSKVRSLLGMLNYVEKFLPNLAENTKILRDLK